jgi:hypothetical protein
MLLFAAALIVAPSLTIAAPSATKAPSDAKSCPRANNYYAWQSGKRVAPRALTELPPANAYYTIYRRIGGCEVPYVVRYGIGR